jgi:hypothetical protein
MQHEKRRLTFSSSTNVGSGIGTWVGGQHSASL